MECTCPEENIGNLHLKECPFLICDHCKMDKRQRNPSGFCDHLNEAYEEESDCEHSFDKCFNCGKDK